MRVKKFQAYQIIGTISRRINKLEIKINERLGNDIVIALDSTGIKVAESWRMDTTQMAC